MRLLQIPVQEDWLADSQKLIVLSEEFQKLRRSFVGHVRLTSHSENRFADWYCSFRLAFAVFQIQLNRVTLRPNSVAER